MADADTPMTDEEFAALNQRLADEQARRQQERLKAQATKLKPIIDLRASDAWLEITRGLVSALDAARGETFFLLFDAMQKSMKRIDDLPLAAE